MRPLTRRPARARTDTECPVARPPLAATCPQWPAWTPRREPSPSAAEDPGEGRRAGEGARRGVGQWPRLSLAQPPSASWSPTPHRDGQHLLPGRWPHSCPAERWPTAGAAWGAGAGGQAGQKCCCPLALPGPAPGGGGHRRGSRTQDPGPVRARWSLQGEDTGCGWGVRAREEPLGPLGGNRAAGSPESCGWAAGRPACGVGKDMSASWGCSGGRVWAAQRGRPSNGVAAWALSLCRGCWVSPEPTGVARGGDLPGTRAGPFLVAHWALSQ